MSKLLLNILAGLFIGFTFFKADNSIQGSQNKLFAIFMGELLVLFGSDLALINFFA